MLASTLALVTPFASFCASRASAHPRACCQVCLRHEAWWIYLCHDLVQKVAWGEDHHDEFKQRFGHSVGIAIMSEDLPEEHNMVTLDSEMTDSDGIPAPKINYTVSENTAKMLEHGVARATEIMEAAGATKVFSSTLRRNAGWHLLGTARMGEDRETAVVDGGGRTHDGSNLCIIDGSIFTTGACVNPTPTLQALALRTADYLKGEGGQVIQ